MCQIALFKGRASRSDESAYVLVGVLILIALSSFVAAGSLKWSAMNARTTHAIKVRTDLFYESEASVGHVVSWFRQNSQQIVTPFRREEFYQRFTRTAPSVGTNEVSTVFTVPTNIKLSGTNDSAVLTSASGLVQGQFPLTEDIVTGSNFPAVSNFYTAGHGESQVRITLVDAIADDPTKDYGPLPNPMPETDFYPVYRIDAMTGDDEGSHVYGTLIGDVVHIFDIGIYGQDYLEINQPCDSYLSASGGYSVASRRANCPAGSNSTASVHKNEEIYGSLQTNGDIDADPPFGGDTCADFQAGCPNKGETCAGEDCGVPLLEFFDPWNVYCPSHQAPVTYAADTTLSVVDSDPSTQEVLPIDRCWQHVIIQPGVTLTLDTTDSPYYIDTLELQNNSNSVLDIKPNPVGGTVEVWVRKIVGDSFNGNQVLNTGKPTEFRLYYLGTDDLLLNGNADMNTALVSPNAGVTVSGNFDYHGALLAKRLDLSGSGLVHYDESLGGTGQIVDVQYRLRDLVQRYR